MTEPGRIALIGWIALIVTPVEASGWQAPPDTLRRDTLPAIDVRVLRMPIELEQAPYAVVVYDRGVGASARPGLGLDEALRGVAGVQVDNRYNDALGERISVRGFGARSQFGVRGVKVVVDGVPATLADGQTALSHVDPRMIGRVEVIRGPASAQWGNAAGGVIAFETTPPPDVPYRQTIDATAGPDGMLRVGATAAGRRGAASYRVAATRLVNDGHRDWSRAEKVYGSGAFGYRTADSEWRVVGHAVRYDAQNPGALSSTLLAEDRTQAYANNRRQRTGEEATQGQLGAVWRRVAGRREYEVSGYGLLRRVDNPIPPAIIDVERAAGGARAIVRSAFGVAGREARWAVGAEIERQSDDRANYVNEEGERGALSLDQHETVTAVGAFAQLTAEVAPRLRVLGAIRYDAFRFEATDRLVGAGDPDDSGRRDMDALSPSVGVLVEAAPWLRLFGNLATSFETPTTTELANRPDGAGGFNPVLEPQRTRSYEAGAKGRFGATLAYELTAYRARVRDALVPFEVPGAEGRQFFRNAGSAVHRGVEAGVAVTLRSGWTGRMAYTYTDAKFEAYAVGGDVYDGNRVPGVAPHRFDATLAYRAARWHAGLDHRRVSRTPVDDANEAHSPSYAVTHLRLGLIGVRVGGVELAPHLAVRNVFDVEHNAAVTVNAFGGRYFEPGPGRSLYVGASLALGAR